MNAAFILPLPGNEAMADGLAAALGASRGDLEVRAFSDGESYVRLKDDVADKHVVLVCTLAQPDGKFLRLCFAAAAARELGARSVGLAAPYLAYMRQDRRFLPGEAVTSRPFAGLISQSFDWMATVDPHLHRYKSLGEIYRIPALTLHAGMPIAAWVKANVPQPFLIGPDEESRQWVGEVARNCGVDYAIFRKIRLGDRDVRMEPPDLGQVGSRTPILLDDVISSGETVMAAARLIQAATSRAPICVAVHGLFAGGSDRKLEAAGIRLVTTNSIPHASNAIDVAPLMASGIASFLR
jgi:ribose-phosphate pyrophosphokinase